MVNVGTGKSGSRFLKTDWPVTEGLIAGTTKLPTEEFLEYEESKVSKKDKEGC